MGFGSGNQNNNYKLSLEKNEINLVYNAAQYTKETPYLYFQIFEPENNVEEFLGGGKKQQINKQTSVVLKGKIQKKETTTKRQILQKGEIPSKRKNINKSRVNINRANLVLKIYLKKNNLDTSDTLLFDSSNSNYIYTLNGISKNTHSLNFFFYKSGFMYK